MGLSLGGEFFEYKPGRGLRIKKFKSVLGGYFSAVYEKRKNYEKTSVDDIAVLIYGSPLRRFRYFFELEANESYQVINGEEYTKRKVDVERLYFDFEVKEYLKVRVGRFITPVGLWNPIHINVLKWTTSDPLTATEFFPKFTTGIQIFGNLPYDISYSIFYQNNRGISENYNNFFTRRFYGGEIRKEFLENFKVGINAGKFELKHPYETVFFFGINAIYKTSRLELSGEYMYASEEEHYLKDKWSHRTSYYVQGVYRVFPKNYAILRYGYFRDKSDLKDYRILTLGWNFRPFYFMVFKAEYQLRKNEKLNTFLASFSWMF